VSLIVGTFSGGDAGEGLDFSGNFEYAVNARGDGGSVIGDTIFTNDSGIISSNQEINDWHSANYGSSANDNSLEFIMKPTCWSHIPEEFNVTLNNLMLEMFIQCSFCLLNIAVIMGLTSLGMVK
jgi:hypothetical protein